MTQDTTRADPTAYLAQQSQLRQQPCTGLVTGVAGFIGSHLLETLLGLGQRVVGLDNFATGHQHNLDEVESTFGEAAWQNFKFIEADIRNLADCQRTCQGVDRVLHQAALGSVPRSLADPITTNGANVTGFLNRQVAVRDAGIKRFAYAASSSTYGDHPGLPKVEDILGRQALVALCGDQVRQRVVCRGFCPQLRHGVAMCATRMPT